MAIDYVGGFGGNHSSKRYLHILVDHFSRYAFTSSTKGQCAKDFIKLIDPVTKQFQIKIILADQYTGINSTELKNYLKNKNITLIFTSIDCAQSNGLNERLNQTLINRIRCKLNNGEKRAWSKIAENCIKEYNNTIHTTTKFSPRYLLYGKTSEIIPVELQKHHDLEKDRQQVILNSEKNF